MVASKVKSGLDLSIDSAKGFQPHTFKKWLNTNKTFTSRYLDPEVNKRLTDLADYGYYGRRFLDDVNPSGSAAALLKAVEPGDIITDFTSKGLTGAVTSQSAGRVKNALKQRQAQKFFAEAIGETPRNRGSEMIDKALQFDPSQALRSVGPLVAPQSAARSQSLSQNEQPQPMPMSNIEKAKQRNMQIKMQKQMLGQ